MIFSQRLVRGIRCPLEYGHLPSRVRGLASTAYIVPSCVNKVGRPAYRHSDLVAPLDAKDATIAAHAKAV